MADTCIHGFAPGTCLICQTLESRPATATKAGGDKAGRRSARQARSDRPARSARSGVAPGAAPAPVRPDAVLPRREPRGSSLGLRLGGFLILAIAVLVAVWLVAGFVLAVLRILELVAVAVVSGWVGWRLGVHHGRHMRS